MQKIFWIRKKTISFLSSSFIYPLRAFKRWVWSGLKKSEILAGGSLNCTCLMWLTSILYIIGSLPSSLLYLRELLNGTKSNFGLTTIGMKEFGRTVISLSLLFGNASFLKSRSILLVENSVVLLVAGFTLSTTTLSCVYSVLSGCEFVSTLSDWLLVEDLWLQSSTEPLTEDLSASFERASKSPLSSDVP